MKVEALKTREWVLAILLIMCSEAFIFYISEVNQRSVNAANYVTIAATLLSIVLAVLAIILSVVTTFSDKETSNSLRQSVETIGTKISILDHISTRIESISSQSEETNKYLVDLRNNNIAFSQFSAEQAPSGNSTATHQQNKDYTDIQSFLSSTTVGATVACGAIIVASDLQKLDRSTIVTNILEQVDSYKQQEGSVFYNLIAYTAQPVFLMLIYLGIFVNNGSGIQIPENFRPAILKKLKQIAQDATHASVSQSITYLIGLIESNQSAPSTTSEILFPVAPNDEPAK